MVSGDSLAFPELDHISLNSFYRHTDGHLTAPRRTRGWWEGRYHGTEIGENTDSLRQGTEGRCEIWRFAERKSVSQGSLGEMQAKSGSLYRKRHANSRCAWLPRKVSGPQRERALLCLALCLSGEMVPKGGCVLREALGAGRGAGCWTLPVAGSGP